MIQAAGNLHKVIWMANETAELTKTTCPRLEFFYDLDYQQMSFDCVFVDLGRKSGMGRRLQREFVRGYTKVVVVFPKLGLCWDTIFRHHI